MAKKRKEKTEEEELDFKIPKFDEEKFLKRERRNIKTTFLSFLFGLIIAVISFGFWALLSGNDFRWELILLVGAFSAAWLKYFFQRLNIDLTDFGRKGWFSTYAIYFVTWLLVLIVVVNPPFYDDDKPIVEVAVLPGMQELGGTVEIVARIMDNAGIEKRDIDFTLMYPDGSNHSPDFIYEYNIFSYTHDSPNNLSGQDIYTFTITATDVNGHVTEKEGSFEYSNDALVITSSIPPKIKSGDSITIKVDEKISPENFRVYYRVNNGSEINADRVSKDDKERYTTSPEYEGWRENSNVTVNVYAEVIQFFKNINVRFNNTVYDTTTYRFFTDDDSDIGEKTPLVTYNCTRYLLGQKQKSGTMQYNLPCPDIDSIPGFELLIFVISLIVVVLIFKYRRKDRRT